MSQTAFVLGNGQSRKGIDIDDLKTKGTVFACNAVYRTHRPHFLIAVDPKMILEIAETDYMVHNKVWSNFNAQYNKHQKILDHCNWFKPSLGWSSGPTALWLASQHGYDKIYILGFDYRGINDKFNNIYADTPNYKKSEDGATFFGNWLRQTVSVIKEHRNIQYIRVIASDNYWPEQLNKFDNFTTITVDDFMKTHQLS